MSMSVEEILLLDIRGIGVNTHSTALHRLKDDIRYFSMTFGDNDYVRSLCASFEALYELATMTKEKAIQEAVDSVLPQWIEVRKIERTQTLREILDVVEEYKTEIAQDHNTTVDWISVDYNELRRHIKELELEKPNGTS